MPLLRKVSLDLCDASEGDFDIPDVSWKNHSITPLCPLWITWSNLFYLAQYADRYFLSSVKIARCKSQRYGLDVQFLEARRKPVHKETLVLVWNSKTIMRTVVKERL